MKREKMLKHMVTLSQLSMPSEHRLVLEFLSLNNCKFKKFIVLKMSLQLVFQNITHEAKYL